MCGPEPTSSDAPRRPTVDAAILFDFGGTLDADGIPWKARFFRLCRSEGIAVTEAMDRVFYRADDALVGTVPPTLSFRDTVHRLAAGVLGGLGHRDDALIARIAERFLADALAHVQANAAHLGRWRARHRLGIVSNFYGNLAAVCADAAVADLFDVVVDSARVGYAKPDPRIFAEAVAALGVPAARTTFVGDSLPRDMVGARDAGLRHVWLAGPDETRAPCCAGDPVIRQLGELDAWLP